MCSLRRSCGLSPRGQWGIGGIKEIIVEGSWWTSEWQDEYTVLQLEMKKHTRCRSRGHENSWYEFKYPVCPYQHVTVDKSSYLSASVILTCKVEIKILWLWGLSEGRHLKGVRVSAHSKHFIIVTHDLLQQGKMPQMWIWTSLEVVFHIIFDNCCVTNASQ